VCWRPVTQQLTSSLKLLAKCSINSIFLASFDAAIRSMSPGTRYDPQCGMSGGTILNSLMSLCGVAPASTQHNITPLKTQESRTRETS